MDIWNARTFYRRLSYYVWSMLYILCYNERKLEFDKSLQLLIVVGKLLYSFH